MIPLPAPYQPFLVRDDFIVRADLFPLPGTYNGRRETRHFELDDQFEPFLTEKLAALARAPGDYRCIDTDQSDALAEVYRRLFAIFAAEHPEYVQIDDDAIHLQLLGLSIDARDPQNVGISMMPDAPEIGRKVAQWLEAQVSLDRFGDALVLSCQEDIVIMRHLPDGRHRAESLHVLLPSTWNPREKYQQSFGTIHEPVAESARLVASADNVMKAIVTRGRYIRFGLSLTTLPSLDNHPDLPKPWDPTWPANPDLLASRVSVRIERQTTYPMPDLHRALFTVRIYSTPLLELAEQRPDLIARLAMILRSASPAVLAYKGIAEYAIPVAEWCESRVAISGQT
jgi:heme-dependent oxidative N-demethylase alpha subunit-like protein